MKKVFSIILFLICVEAYSKFHSSYHFTLDNPMPTNSFKGKISTGFHYQLYQPFKSIKLPVVLKTGISYSALKNHLNQHLNNIYLNTGFCRSFKILNVKKLPNISIKPYFTAGYSIFKDKITNNCGFSMESGIEIYQSKFFHNYKTALHFSYRQNFLNEFEYAYQTKSGEFGMFLIGASFFFKNW